MAQYPVRMLKDENGQHFVPICGVNSLVYDDQTTLQEKLDAKLDEANLEAGDGITLTPNGDKLVISTSVNYAGTETPTDDIGNDGDLYILIESK